ncbi:unnamed protein product [Penicillium salamii]|nr:unnamed protein product [Penicillium salamii]
MCFSVAIILASVYTHASLSGTLEIIDIDKKCVIWSNDNYGCTGSSAFFSQLNRDYCLKLDKVKVEEPSVITFYNLQGDRLRCELDNGLKYGSWCTASDLLPATESSSSESSSTKLSYTEASTSELSFIKLYSPASSSAEWSSAFTMRESSSSATKPLTTFQTAPISDCS